MKLASNTTPISQRRKHLFDEKKQVAGDDSRNTCTNQNLIFDRSEEMVNWLYLPSFVLLNIKRGEVISYHQLTSSVHDQYFPR